jgi:hypothetical protein
MNLVYIDALFRHILWTGDLDYAKKVWPIIERHLAWERRLFRRPFGADGLPLYEGYCAFWASDDVAYSGGGATHASAYNYYHNKMAARLAPFVGADPKPYTREAELIARAMRELLWLAEQGTFAEFKDYLGLQRVHRSPALWSFYHTIDSEVTTPEEAQQMTHFIDTEIAHLPLRGPGVPEGNYTLATSNWMPYTWSTNNVVMAETAHTALAFWQSGRSDEANHLFKGAILDSMFMGLCPGNVGMTTPFDMARGESQRDFADAIGMTARGLVEGLFGIKPDLLAGELRISPGFPAEWERAQLHHPDIDLSYKRTGPTESFRIESRLQKPVITRLQIPARGVSASVTINGKPAEWHLLDLPAPRVEILCQPSTVLEIAVTWAEPRHCIRSPNTVVEKWPQVAETSTTIPATDWHTPLPESTHLDPVDLTPFFNDRVTQIFKNKYLSPRSPYCSLAIPTQGIGSWCRPNDIAEIDDSGLRAVAQKNHGHLTLPNGIAFATVGTGEARNIIFTSQWDNYPHESTVPLSGKAHHIYLLMAGSTNPTQSRFDNGEIIVSYRDGSTERLALENPTTWWPIDEDYLIDDYAFRRPEPLPVRVDLKTGNVRILDMTKFKGHGGKVPGGAATVLDLALSPDKELQSLTVRILANEVVIGLMSATLMR